jgi:Tol biopolymer transport system component
METMKTYSTTGEVAMVLASAVFIFGLHGCTGSGSPVPASPFANPQPVTISGYSGDAMEPFISRDGNFLFFNDRNTAPTTRLYYATQIDPLHFQFQGEVGGVNTAQLDAVPSLDSLGNFYFISNRSYSQNLSTVYAGTFNAGNVAAVAPVPGIVARGAGVVDFDAEISGDGHTLYFSEGPLDNTGQPQGSQIIISTRDAAGFTRLSNSGAILQQINAGTLNYAAAMSSSELEIFFTRLDATGPAIYEAARPDKASAFGTPARIAAIRGFAEAPSLSPDEKSLYYHLRTASGGFTIYRVTRP